MQSLLYEELHAIKHLSAVYTHTILNIACECHIILNIHLDKFSTSLTKFLEGFSKNSYACQNYCWDMHMHSHILHVYKHHTHKYNFQI